MSRVIVIMDASGEAELKLKVKEYAEHLGEEIEGDAQRGAPVRTGHLRDGIDHEVEDAAGKYDQNLKVFATADYAEYVERGTHNDDGTTRMAAQPYLGPALYRVRG